MKGATNSAGFTIVETLLVLAVTSALFVMVAVTFSGRQDKTQFEQAARDIQTKVQQIINEQASGYFPNTQDFTCVESVPGQLKITSAPAGTVKQGENQDCVFLGKMIQFRANGSAPTVPEPYNVYSLAGLRSATTFNAAQATIIDGAGINVTQTNYLEYGMTTKWMKYYVGGVGNNINTVGFISRLGSLSDSKTLESGAVDVLPVVGSDVTMNDTQTSGAINTDHLVSSYPQLNPDGGIKVCFQSGGTTATALLSIGANGHNIAVKLEIIPC